MRLVPHRLVLLATPIVLGASHPDTPRPQEALRSGHVLVANQQSANVTLIDLRTDNARTIAVGAGPHEAVISPSGRVGVVTIYGVGGAPGNQLVVIDIPTGNITRTISLGEYTRPHGAAFIGSDDSRVVVTSETTQKLVVVDLTTGSVTAAYATGATGSHMVALTADARRAFTANIFAGSMSEIDMTNGALVRTIPIAPRSEGIATVPDGSTVWVGSNTNNTVHVVDARRGVVTDTLTGFAVPYRLASSQDGQVIIVCDAAGDRIQVIDVARRTVLWTLGGLPAPRGVNIAPDGRHAFVTLAGENAVAIVDLQARKVDRKLPVGTAPDGVWYGVAPR